MKITIVCSIKDSEKLEIVKIPDSFCKDGLVYTFSNDKISLYDYAKEVEYLKEQLNKAKEVIGYYANPENWDFEEILDDVEFCEDPQANLGGKRARDFLLKLEGKCKIVE